MAYKSVVVNERVMVGMYTPAVMLLNGIVLTTGCEYISMSRLDTYLTSVVGHTTQSPPPADKSYCTAIDFKNRR